MRRLPREGNDPRGPNVCPRCGKVHKQKEENCQGAREPREPREQQGEREVREIRKEQRREERTEERRERCRCPYCGHDFAWPLELCPRCGKVHDAQRPWVSPGASSFEAQAPSKPPEGGFSRLFGNTPTMILMMMMLFGGGMGSVSEIRKLFMHPMFQLLETMGNLREGGNLIEALGPILNGADMGALGNILAGLGKEDPCEEE